MTTMTRKCRMLVTMLIALGTVGMGATSAHAAPTQVPFTGSYAGTLTSTSPTTVALSGTGVATYLGPITEKGLITIQGPASCAGGFAVLTNETLANATGNALTLAFNAVMCPVSPGVFQGTGTWVVSGGTGQFSGAAGQGTTHSIGDFNQDLFGCLLTGAISAPGKS